MAGSGRESGRGGCPLDPLDVAALFGNDADHDLAAALGALVSPAAASAAGATPAAAAQPAVGEGLLGVDQPSDVEREEAHLAELEQRGITRSQLNCCQDQCLSRCFIIGDEQTREYYLALHERGKQLLRYQSADHTANVPFPGEPARPPHADVVQPKPVGGGHGMQGSSKLVLVAAALPRSAAPTTQGGELAGERRVRQRPTVFDPDGVLPGTRRARRLAALEPMVATVGWACVDCIRLLTGATTKDLYGSAGDEEGLLERLGLRTRGVATTLCGLGADELARQSCAQHESCLLRFTQAQLGSYRSRFFAANRAEQQGIFNELVGTVGAVYQLPCTLCLCSLFGVSAERARAMRARLAEAASASTALAPAHGRTGVAPANRSSPGLLAKVARVMDMYTRPSPEHARRVLLLPGGVRGLLDAFKHDYPTLADGSSEEMPSEATRRNLIKAWLSGNGFEGIIAQSKDHNVCFLCELYNTQMRAAHICRAKLGEPGASASGDVGALTERLEAVELQIARTGRALEDHRRCDLLMRKLLHELSAAIASAPAGARRAQIQHFDAASGKAAHHDARSTTGAALNIGLPVAGYGDPVHQRVTYLISPPGGGSESANSILNAAVLGLFLEAEVEQDVLVLVLDCASKNRNGLFAAFAQMLVDAGFFKCVLIVFMGRLHSKYFLDAAFGWLTRRISEASWVGVDSFMRIAQSVRSSPAKGTLCDALSFEPSAEADLARLLNSLYAIDGVSARPGVGLNELDVHLFCAAAPGYNGGDDAALAALIKPYLPGVPGVVALALRPYAPLPSAAASGEPASAAATASAAAATAAPAAVRDSPRLFRMALHKLDATAAKPCPYLPDSALQAAAESGPLDEEDEDEEGEREFEPNSDDEAAGVDVGDLDEEDDEAAGEASGVPGARDNISLATAQRATAALAASTQSGVPRRQRRAGPAGGGDDNAAAAERRLAKQAQAAGFCAAWRMPVRALQELGFNKFKVRNSGDSSSTILEVLGDLAGQKASLWAGAVDVGGSKFGRDGAHVGYHCLNANVIARRVSDHPLPTRQEAETIYGKHEFAGGPLAPTPEPRGSKFKPAWRALTAQLGGEQHAATRVTVGDLLECMLVHTPGCVASFDGLARSARRGATDFPGEYAAIEALRKRRATAGFEGVPRKPSSAYQLVCADLRARAAARIPPLHLPPKEVNASWRLYERRHPQGDGHFHTLARAALEAYNIDVVLSCAELAQQPDDSLLDAPGQPSPVAPPPYVLDLTLGDAPPPEVPSVIDLEHNGGTRRVSLVRACNVRAPAASGDDGASDDDEPVAERVLCLGFDERRQPFWLVRRFPLLGEVEDESERDFAWPSIAPSGGAAQSRLPGAHFTEAAKEEVSRILSGAQKVPIISKLNVTNANARLPAALATEAGVDAELELARGNLTRAKRIWLAAWLSSTLSDAVYLPEGLAPLLTAARAHARASVAHGGQSAPSRSGS